MSVLTQIVHERATWDSRRSKFALKMRQFREVLEYALLIAIGYVIYFHHAQLMELAGRLFN